MTIIMVIHNELESVKLAVESVRLFADIEDLSLVVVDNHSVDATDKWATAQEDITYIYMDEGELPFGQALNRVRTLLQIDDDLLIMDALMLAPQTLSRLQELLYSEETVGAVGGVSNSFVFDQNCSEPTDYEMAVGWAESQRAVRAQGRLVLGLQAGAVLLKSAVIAQLGDFDEELRSREGVMKDYALRMVMHDWKQQICETALFWDIRGNSHCHEESREEAELLEKKWGMHYFNTYYNGNLVGMIAADRDAHISVLEIGCDCGANLLEIRNRYPQATVFGVELNEKAATVASHIARVQVCDIEGEEVQFSDTFDYIVFGDVLEHLHNPLKAIQRCKKLLKADGHIVASIPNLMHISVMEMLLQGNFSYAETGLLDRTHIHFFTFKEIMRMFEAGGYEVEECITICYPISPTETSLIDRLLALRDGAQRFMYEAFQYVIRAKRM